MPSYRGYYEKNKNLSENIIGAACRAAAFFLRNPCGAEKPAADTTASLQETTAAETSGIHEVPDNLPADLDFGGKSFRMVFQAEEYRVQSIVEEETGDVVNDAVS